MALKGVSITVCYQAWNTSTNAGQTGDSANHTLKLVQDGTEASPTNSPTQVDATNLPGLYKLVLAAADVNFNVIVVGGVSSTTNVVIIPFQIITEQGVLPTTVCTTRTNSLLTSGTGTDQLSVSAGKVLLQATQTGVTIPSVTTVGSVTGAVGSVTGNVGGNVVGSTASVTGAVGSVTGNVGGNVSGSVGSISGVTFPSHFSSLAIDTSGNVTFNNTSIGSVTGSVASVTAAVTISLTQTLSAARALDAIADTSLTLNDALQCAVNAISAQLDASSGTSLVIKTANTGTTLRTKTLTTTPTPTAVVDKAV